MEQNVKEIAVLYAYLDESGTHGGSSLLVVAGWVGDAETWKSFVEEWMIHLRNAGIPYFHTHDPECEQLKRPLIHAILARRLLPVAWSVNPLEFRENTSDKFTNQLGNAYATCAHLCAGLINNLAIEKPLPPVALIYESGQPNTEFISRSMNNIIADPANHKLASITFLSKKDPFGIPLQAADFLAYILATNESKWIDQLRDADRLPPLIGMPPEKLRNTTKQLGIKISRERAARKARRKNPKGEGG
ncbi:MAG: DUF3800 domain-containing protein [Syntrophorhabdales bacterium]|jgi:hypothetical protein